MSENIFEARVRAKHGQLCDCCGEPFGKGEDYVLTIMRADDGHTYPWREHSRCRFIKEELWEYIDSFYGITKENFMDAAGNVCRTFVCPDCEKYNHEEERCGDGKVFCLGHLYGFLKTHKLYRADDGGCIEAWRARPRGKHE